MILAILKLNFKYTSIMLCRTVEPLVYEALNRQAAVGLIGPRQVGKTTLARALSEKCGGLYLDLESPTDLRKLQTPDLYLRTFQDRLVVLDEIHRAPEIFNTLRGLIDEGRRAGKRTGQFLILGSASIDLLKQSSESLAGRIEYIEMNTLNCGEVENSNVEMLWVRGGFPDSFLSATDIDSVAFRQSFIRTYLERDVPQFGPRIPATTLRRLWMMLANLQGSTLNASKLASSLGVSSPTVSSYIDLLIDLLLIRKLPPYSNNGHKRLVKSPKIYLRDSGLLHTLLNINDYDELLGHPIIGASWEGLVLENILSLIPPLTQASFYRTTAGAEVDLVIEFGKKIGTWVVEVKRSLAPVPTKGFYNAIEDIQPRRAFVVYPGAERYPISESVEAIGLSEMISLVMQRGTMGQDPQVV